MRALRNFRKIDVDWLKETLLTCSETGERQQIWDVRGLESGVKDGLEVTTRGKSTAWRFKIVAVEEMDPDALVEPDTTSPARKLEGGA